MKCKYCNDEAKYDEHCETHWMLGVFFQYELAGQLWSLNDDSQTFVTKYENWINELSDKTIENIRKNYWLK